MTRAYILGLGCAAFCACAVVSVAAEATIDDSNPYAVISDKNIFHLNPPPPLTPVVAPKPPDLQKVMLSGFQKIGDRMKVYMAVVAKDPKDTAYLALQTGEKERDVEVVKIRADKQEVDIINTGTPMTLTIASNGFALTGGGGAGGKPERGPMPGPSLPGGRARMPLMPGAPPPGVAPAAAAANEANSSAIIMGGGGSSAGGSAYQGNAFVSGGAAPYNPQPVAGAPNAQAAQIANTLLNGAQESYHPPAAQNVPPAPLPMQAAGLLLNEAAGGPPSPVANPDENK